MKKYLTLALLSLSWVSFARATNYYLRADGTAANKGAATGPCTTASATMSMATHNAATFSAGDTIYVCNDGGTIRSQLVVRSSGSAGNPITYAAGQSAKPIITPSTLVKGWSLYSGSVYRAPYATRAYSVWEDNTYLPSVGSLGALTAPGEWYIDTSEHLLYVWTLDSSDPSGHTMEAGSSSVAQGSAILMRSISYVTIQDLILEKNSATTKGLIEASASDHVIMSRLEIRYGGHQAYGMAFTEGDHNIIQDSLVHDLRNDGIYFKQSSTYDSVLRNTLYNIGQNTDAGDNGAICFGGVDGASDHGLIEGNLVYNIGHSDSQGHNHTIEVDRSSYTTVRYNVIHDSFKGGISLGGSVVTPVTDSDIYGNVIYNINKNSGSHYGQAPGILLIDVDRVNVYNNTIWNVGSNTFGDSVIYAGSTDGATLDHLAIFNNIIGPSIGSHRCNLEFGSVTFTNRTEDNNLFYDSAGLIITNGASTYTNLASYQAAVKPKEANSLNSNPLFTNVSGYDFTLQSRSPAIDAGEKLGSTYQFGLDPRTSFPYGTLNRNSQGSGWEIGAFVFVQLIPVSPPQSLSATVK